MKRILAAVLMGTVLNVEFISGMEFIPANMDFNNKVQRLKVVYDLMQTSLEGTRNYDLRNAKSMLSKIVEDFNMPFDLLDMINASNSLEDLVKPLFLMTIYKG